MTAAANPTLANPTKNRAAAQLLADADVLANKIKDTSTPMTKAELDQAAENIRALRARADLIMEMTPAEEMNRQARAAGLDGDDPAHRRSMDGDEAEVASYTDRVKQYNKDFGRAFGTLGGFRRAGRNLTTKQREVLERGQRLLAMTRATDDPIIGDTGDPSGGEFLLPLQQEPSIFRIDNKLNGVFERAQKYNALGRTLRIPYVIQDSSAGGVTRPVAGIANWAIVGEGDEKPEQEPKFQQRLLTVYKGAGISKIGDETLADDLTGGQLPATVISQVGQQGINFFNELMTVTGRGAGSNEPLGALHANNTARIVVNRHTTQTITVDDVLAMFEQFAHGPDAIWLHTRNAFAALAKLTLTGNSLVTYLQNLNESPSGRSLFGYPLILCDILPQLGVEGDFALVNPAFYAAAIRQQLTVQSSVHVEFINDLTTWRFILRAGGIPIPTSTYAYAADGGGNKINPYSPFVVLGDAITS